MKGIKKLYVVTKLVYATDLEDAIKQERRVKPQEIWIDDNERHDLIMGGKGKESIGFKAKTKK